MPAILLTPGPTPLPPSVRARLSGPVLHHRTPEFEALFRRMSEGLRAVFRTRNAVLSMAASGTGAMESAAANLLSRGDRVLVHATCVFGDRFARIVRAYGLEPVVLEEEWGRAADPDRLRSALKKERGLKAVFHQHVSTPTGVVNDIRTLAAAVREGSDALTVVDAVSGLGGQELETDGWGVDVAVGASQKALMNPPGLAFAAVSERAWKAAERADLPRFYLDWRMMRAKLPSQTPFTAPVNLVAGMEEALRLIREEGVENVWKRTAALAEHVRARVRELGLALFAARPADVVTAVRLPEGADGVRLLREMRESDGVQMAGGQLGLKGKIVRIAHMGHIRKPDVDAGLAALRDRLEGAQRR